MEASYYTLMERISEQFSEIDGDMVMELRSNSTKYSGIKNQIRQLDQEYPAIQRLLEDEGEIHLSADEHKALLDYLQLYLEATNMEREHIYFRGHTDGFAYLNKIGAFKTE